MKPCARNGCPMQGEWHAAVLVWGEGTDHETGVPLEIKTNFVVCSGHREDGKYPDIIDDKLKRIIRGRLNAEHKVPADWRTARWQYVHVSGGAVH